MENYEKETIAAIATALSDSGIGIVRISGENAIYIVDSIFRSASGKKILTKVQSHMIHYGYIVDKDENIIDEVMTSVMKAPKSYTMEDTVEINCHGGVLVMQKVLETVLQVGARLAEPGEFTKRAFLNGRIDLSRAEAVIDVIHSQNEYALSSTVSQLKGRLSDKIRSLRKALKKKFKNFWQQQITEDLSKRESPRLLLENLMRENLLCSICCWERTEPLSRRLPEPPEMPCMRPSICMASV